MTREQRDIYGSRPFFSKGFHMPTVSAHVALTLAQHIDHVFGVMGNGNAYFLDAIETQTDATFTAVRHEQGSVVAADAHFRASGRIAAATTTYGAGFTNTITSLAEAVQAHVPLVLVVGDEPTSGPRPWDVDQIALASAVGARTYTTGRADAAATTVIAIEHALTYRVPVVLAIPYDVAALEAGPVPAAPAPRTQVARAEPAPSQTQTPGLAKRSMILFAAGAPDPSRDSLSAIKFLAGDLNAALAGDASSRIQLQAFGGDKGDKGSDARRLSLKRALAIRQVLIDVGVSPDRINVSAMGDHCRLLAADS